MFAISLPAAERFNGAPGIVQLTLGLFNVGLSTSIGDILVAVLIVEESLPSLSALALFRLLRLTTDDGDDLPLAYNLLICGCGTSSEGIRSSTSLFLLLLEIGESGIGLSRISSRNRLEN